MIISFLRRKGGRVIKEKRERNNKETDMNKLTKEEALKLYGDVPLKFDHYYKYVFTFVGFAEDGAEVYINIGGTGEDIYRFEVDQDTRLTLNRSNFNGFDYRSAVVRISGVEVWRDNNERW
jgi:hypothetical protein